LVNYINSHLGILTDQFTQTGGYATFTCVDDLSYNYTWEYNGMIIDDDPGHIEGATTSILTISNVTTSDWGTYYCIATNSITSVTLYGVLHGKCGINI